MLPCPRVSQSSRPVSVVVAPVVANTPHLVLMLALVLPTNSSPESGAGAAASTAWSCRPHNLSLLTMSYLDTMSPQTSDIPTIPTVTDRITRFYNYQSLERSRLALAPETVNKSTTVNIIPSATFLSAATICIMQATQNWFLATSVKNVFTKHSTIQQLCMVYTLGCVWYTNRRILQDNNSSLQSEE